jgi:hypothetical protein
MAQAIRSRPGGEAPAPAALPAPWVALQRHLARRVARLNAENSHYPTPIARCDQHLAALLEQRAALFERLRRMDEIGGAFRDAIAFLDSPVDGVDETEEALRGRLRGELAKLGS